VQRLRERIVLRLGVFGVIVGSISGVFWLLASLSRTSPSASKWSDDYVTESVRLGRVLTLALLPSGLFLVALSFLL
jgi:hypothetical protein